MGFAPGSLEEPEERETLAIDSRLNIPPYGRKRDDQGEGKLVHYGGIASVPENYFHVNPQFLI